MVWGVFDWGDGAPQKSEDGSEADYPECDYDSNLTPLYEAIEERAWIAVNQFLHSGYWPESLFADGMTPEEQARTWVTRYETRPDGSKKVRWSQLPIHAAVIFGAPSVVIQQLVEAFPQSVRCTDDHRMLPLHLAFRHGSDDSVLALFLEEFPEAVNVRGYKGRLPVECAQKGPNPERGAIIQTILHKNQSVWERKKSAVQLKELYCIKEALKIKSQKVSHLETAIREIKSREHKTRKELAATMTELKAAKIKTKVDDENMSNADKSAERQAVKQLVEKLAALEMATKDLVDKEKSTKKELRKTLAELEAAKGMKPSEDQVEQFSKLEKVASHEEGDKLARKGEDEEAVDENADDGEDKELAIKVYSIKADATSSHKPATVSSRKTERSARTPASSKTDEKKRAEAKKADEKKKKEEKKRAAEAKKTEAGLFHKAEAMLAKRGEKAAIKKAEKAVFGAEDASAAKSKATAKSARSSDKIPYLKLSTSREEERKKLRKVEERNVALVLKIAELEAAKNEQEELRKVEDRRSELKKAEQKIATKMEKEAAKLEAEATREELRKAAATNEALEKKIATLTTNEALERKIATLENTMKDYEDKQARAQEEFDVASLANKQTGQTEQMLSLQFELKDLQENSNRTKRELDAALQQLQEMRNEQEARAAAAVVEKKERNREAEETNKKLEKKVALLELALKQFDEKSTVARSEMNNIKETIMQDTDVKLTAAQQRYMNRLEESMKKLEKNAKKTKKELDNALAELDAMKAKEAENAQLLAAVEKEKFRSVEQTNKALEEKIRILEYTMQCFEEKAAQTKQEMNQAMEDLKKSDESTVASGESMKLTKKQKKHMLALENAMKKLEDRATGTKDELDKALTELRDLKQAEEVAYVKNEAQLKKENKALKDLSKKVQALQTAMVGFEVKETRTMQELEKAMQELEDVSNKRFEVLSMAAEKAEELATDNAFTKEVVKLEKRATQEEKRLEELEKAVQEVISKSGMTRDELERTQSLLQEVKAKEEARDPPLTKAEKEEVKNEKKLVKDLTKKVATLQSAVIGFEVKETRTMKELEHTMKQLEELTSKRFEVLEQAATLKEKDTERLAAAGALAEEKVAALHTAMKELEDSATKTHEELERTKVELEDIKKANEESLGGNKEVIEAQDGQIKDLNEKITVLQQAVMGFEVKETKTMQELEQTMKQLEELTAKRFEVLQKVAGREIEAAKAAEADKYTKKAAAEEKKVAALEFAMRELESKAYKTKLELERTMKGLEHLEEKQEESQKELSGVTMEEKRVMRELVNKVADIQDAVMAYDEKEHKTNQELEKTKKELEATKREVEELREKQAANEIQVIPTGNTEDAQSAMEAVEVNEADVQSVQEKEATETAKRVTEETLTSLETAIHRLVERLGTEEDQEGANLLAEKIATEFSTDRRIVTGVDELKEAYSRDISQPEADFVPEDLVPTPVPVPAPVPTTISEPQQPPPVEPSEPSIISNVSETKKRYSFFGRKTATATKTRPPKSPKKKQQAEKKKRMSWFGSRKNTTKSEPAPAAPPTPAPAPAPMQVTTPTPTPALPDAPAPAPAAPLAVTPEQRRAVEEVHGAQITALLTDQQVLDLLSKMPANTDSASLLTNEINIASTKSGSLDKGTVGGQSASIQTSLQSNSLLSAPSSGMKQQDPHMMIVSLPSQRVQSAQPSAAPAIPTSPSMRSTKSARSSQRSEKTVPTSPRSPRSRGSVSPAPLSPAGSAKMTGTTSPRSQASMKSKGSGTKKNNSMTAQDVLVANGTYDDGFEINF